MQLLSILKYAAKCKLNICLQKSVRFSREQALQSLNEMEYQIPSLHTPGSICQRSTAQIKLTRALVGTGALDAGDDVAHVESDSDLGSDWKRATRVRLTTVAFVGNGELDAGDLADCAPADAFESESDPGSDSEPEDWCSWGSQPEEDHSLTARRVQLGILPT